MPVKSTCGSFVDAGVVLDDIDSGDIRRDVSKVASRLGRVKFTTIALPISSSLLIWAP